MKPSARLDELYHKLLAASARGQAARAAQEATDEEKGLVEMDCLFHPNKYPLVWQLESCDDCDEEQRSQCGEGCVQGAFAPGQPPPEECVGCAACVDNCPKGALAASKDALAVMELLQNRSGPVYAMVAPAFLGQFSENVTPGMLRAAFKKIGFEGMLEVAVFADILTLKEALEFDANIQTESDYQLTSCCCPMWIAMIRKVYNELMPHVPPAVSPMVAAGRTVKHITPGAATVFIGPCMAKKAEAREPDLKGAVDHVLTFEEMRDIFDALAVDPAAASENEKEFSSRAGRIYARAGGVSEAVRLTVERLSPGRSIAVKTKAADGVPACRELLNGLRAGEITANFFEGMGCVGGCVGGPKSLIDKDEARRNVEAYGEKAAYQSPADNPYVIELLRRLGIETLEGLMEQSDIFTRRF